jgi:hypothetical protein
MDAARPSPQPPGRQAKVDQRRQPDRSRQLGRGLEPRISREPAQIVRHSRRPQWKHQNRNWSIPPVKSDKQSGHRVQGANRTQVHLAWLLRQRRAHECDRHRRIPSVHDALAEQTVAPRKGSHAGSRRQAQLAFQNVDGTPNLAAVARQETPPADWELVVAAMKPGQPVPCKAQWPVSRRCTRLAQPRRQPFQGRPIRIGFESKSQVQRSIRATGSNSQTAAVSELDVRNRCGACKATVAFGHSSC